MHKKILIYFLFLPIFFGAFSTQKIEAYSSYGRLSDPTDRLVGYYDVVGKNDIYRNKSYRGKAKITKCGNNYEIEWSWSTGGVTTGFGVRNGDSIAFSYYTANGSCAVVLYQITEEGTLDGIWAVDGTRNLRIEKLVPDR